jgi:AAA+ ATPase superfamily predicted ATPase
MMKFVNRKEELEYLEKVYKEEQARFLIVYGRRRIGKTELLRHFSHDKKHLFFSSDLSSEQEQLRQFSEKIYQLTGEAFLLSQPFSSWEALLRYLFDHLVTEVPLIIIDEFPYLCAGNTALPSILQKIWDEQGKDSPVFLVLCGSYMSFMEKKVLGHKSPLFGRRTGQMLLQPMGFQDTEAFFPGYSKEARVPIYAILGGTPSYLQRFSASKTLEENIKEEILDKNALLYSEPRFLLMEELREPSLYFSILKAIAFGKTRLNEIVQEAGIADRHTVNKYLSVLKELYMVRREVPVTEERPHKSRKGIYLLRDPFFRFWFRYVFPNFSYLEEGDIEYVWQEKIKVSLESFVGPVFEQICVETLKRLNRKNKLPFKAARIGRWWDRSREIDIIAYDENGSCLFCECKWTTKAVGKNILGDLQEKAQSAFPDVAQKYFGLFSRSGFRDELKEFAAKQAELLLFDY